jgi:hypothetical protein
MNVGKVMERETNALIEILAGEAIQRRCARGPFVFFGCVAPAMMLYTLLLALALGPRPDLLKHMLETPLFAGEILTLGAVALASLLGTSLLAFPDLYQRRALAFGLPCVALGAFALVMTLEWLAAPLNQPPLNQLMPAHGFECARCILLSSALPLFLLLSLLRRYAPTYTGMAGCMSALAASALGCLALRLSEKTDSVAHLLEWHYLPVTLLSALMLPIARKWLAWQG